MAGNRWGDTHIIRVDMLEQIWYTTFTFDWLYKDTPELNHIDDVISEVINIKIETLINDKS
jgi:hypothetical protein